MADKLELSLDPNGEHIKLRWSKEDEPPSKPLRLKSEQLRVRSADVRGALNALNSYVRTNQKFEEEKDPGWRRYADVLRTLREKGEALHNALLIEDDPRSQEFMRAIEELPQGAELRVVCSDDEVSLPLGFVFEGEVDAPVGKPSRSDFAGFWLDRLKITMLVEGGGAGPERRSVDPLSLKTLYALHRTELENAVPYLGGDAVKLKQLTLLPVKDHYNWNSAKRNCCLSVSGGEGGSLLSAAARKGFCGLVGTEAEILNTYALRCGTRLMWDLCFKGRSLGEALDEMQSAEDLFPLNLLYTCYAQRDFELLRPVDPIDPIDQQHEQLEAA